MIAPHIIALMALFGVLMLHQGFFTTGTLFLIAATVAAILELNLWLYKKEREVARKELDDMFSEASDEDDERDRELYEKAIQISRYKDELTPSQWTKYHHNGSYKFTIPEINQDGIEVQREVYVPWSTVKEIMNKIRRLAET